jgi:hypothetical protein
MRWESNEDGADDIDDKNCMNSTSQQVFVTISSAAELGISMHKSVIMMITLIRITPII